MITMSCCVQHCKSMAFCGPTPWFLLVFVCFTLFEHASFTVFQHILLTGTSLKSCLGATSDLNEFFKKCQISLMTGCHYTTPRAAGLSSVTGKHRRTSSRYRVASSVVDISSGREKSLFAICFRRGADWGPIGFYHKTSFLHKNVDYLSTSARTRNFGWHLPLLRLL